MSIVATDQLREVAESEFADIVEQVLLPDINEMRILLADGSFVDVWFSLKLEGRYSHHWERRAIDGSIYRHDNAPHRRWQAAATFPKHFHDGSELNVISSTISEIPQVALREFLAFVRSKLTSR
jgi:hypothetical protein